MFELTVKNQKTGETAGFAYATRELADHCADMFPEPAYLVMKGYEDIVVETPDDEYDYLD